MEYKDFVADIDGQISKVLSKASIDEQIGIINSIKLNLHNLSPFKNEPVDCVVWKKADNIVANDYNPNTVAPPEMELLYQSISQDGYTQPIVTWGSDAEYEVIDGFHRNRVGREHKDIEIRTMGYLPITIVNEDRQARNDRIASTIRHNRARGKHRVESMSDIVIELKKRNWSTNRICKELGMDQDEVLRLCQIKGLVEVFADAEFSQAWDAEIFSEDDFDTLNDEDIQ